MPSQPFQRGAELRRKIRETKAQEVVHLEHGCEYEGPFILDKPISLVGHGDATQLFARGGPAVVVLAPGVRLEHLGLSDSLDLAAGTCLLIEHQAAPVLVNVRKEGRVTTVSRDQVVDLGDLLPQQQGLSFLEVEVAGPSRVRCGESSSRWLWAGFGESFEKSLPAAGRYLLRLACDAKAIGPGGLAVGELHIETGADVQTLWITVQVFAEQPAKLLTGDIALRSAKSHLIRFADGFLVGRSRFPGLSAASSMPERQAILLREAVGGVWAIFQPWPTPAPTFVGGVPLALGQRRLLFEGDQICAAGLDLQVEAFRGTSTFSATSTLIDLGVANGQPSRAGFKLRYHGSSKDKLTLHATVPWLRIDPASIEIKKNETLDVQIDSMPAVVSLPPARHRERGAILIHGKGETLCLDATVEVPAEFIAPRAAGSLDFGTITDWEKAGASVTIGNGGSKEWRPAVQVNRDWLTPGCTSLRVPPGRDMPLSLRLNNKVLDLPPGDQSGLLRLEGDGAVLELPVTVRLQIDLGPVPCLVSPPLDFREVDDWESAAAVTVIVQNRGRRDWQTVLRAVPWLDVPADLTVPAGKQRSFVVRLNGKLPVGAHAVKDAILLQGDGKTLAVEVRVKALPPTPRLEASSNPIDFGSFENWSTAPVRQLTLRNRGRVDWSGMLTCIPAWLEVEGMGGAVRCPARSQIELSLRINEQIPEGCHEVAGALMFQGNGIHDQVGVRAHYRLAPKIRCSLHSRHRIDFSEAAGVVNPVQIVLQNEGGKDGSVSVKADALPAWLDVQPRALTVPCNGQAAFEVRLTPEVDRLVAGSHRAAQAIVLQGDGVGCPPIEVGVTVPPYEMEVEPRELLLAIEKGRDLSALRRELRLQNLGRRLWEGRIESLVPWLEVEPQRAQIPPGQTLDFAVRATEAVCDLSSGEQLFGQVIVFEGLPLGVAARVRMSRGSGTPIPPPAAGSGPQVGMPTCAREPSTDSFRILGTALPYAREQPDQLDIAPSDGLDFGKVSRGTEAVQTIAITNRGDLLVSITVHVRAPWLKVSPPGCLECPAGSTLLLHVALRFGPFQPVGTLFEPQALVLVTGGHNYPVAVRVETT